MTYFDDNKPSAELSRFARDNALALLCLGGITLLLCWAAAQFFDGLPGLTAVWPANAVVLAFIARRCRTPVAIALALAIAAFAMVVANLIVARPLAATLLFPLANVAEIAVAAWFLRNVAMPMSAPRDLGQFLRGAVLAGPLVSSLIASGVSALFFGSTGEALLEFGGSWFLADALGMAIVAPFLLSKGVAAERGALRALAAPTLILVIALALCFQTRLPLLFLAFPMVALAVLHDRGRGGALAVGSVALAIIGTGAIGYGPAALMARGGLDPVQVLQVFFAALVVTVHPLAAALTRLDDIAAEEQRRRVVAEADSAAKTEVLGRVGEDLRSPLTGVVTVAEMLRSGRMGDLNSRQRELLACIAESGAEIEALSHEMMLLAESGEGTVSGDCAVAEAVGNAVAASRFLARRARVEIQAMLGDPTWRVGLDQDRLRRAVLDILTQAIEASPAGQVVRIVVGLGSDAAIEISVDDAAAGSLASRQKAFQSGQTNRDRAAIRRAGGSFELGRGALGGARYSIMLPRTEADVQTSVA